ncbi:hypothetical protein D3C74_316170 [compost metagenome]
MQNEIRIKFSESLEDQQALSKAGGRIINQLGKPPKFSFPSEYHYRQYLTYRRMAKNEKMTAATNSDHSKI